MRNQVETPIHIPDNSGEAPPYPLEEKTEERWRAIVNTFAPSYANVDPARVFAVTYLPEFFPIDTAAVRRGVSKKVHSIPIYRDALNSEAISPSGIPALVSNLSRAQYQYAEGLQQDFLRRVLYPVARKPITLGLHTSELRPSEGGVIFLPENSNESRNWSVLFNLNYAVQREGQGLIVKYFEDSLDSLAQDFSANANSDTVKRLRSLVWVNGYGKLVENHYAQPHSEALKKDSLEIIVTEHVAEDFPKDRRERGTALLSEVMNFVEKPGIPSKDAQPATLLESNIIDKVKRAAEELDCEYEDATMYVHRALGLSVTVRELRRTYPHNTQRTLDVLAALTFPGILNMHAHNEVKSKRPGVQPIISSRTLHKIEKDVSALQKKQMYHTPIQGMSDAILSHELFHALFTHFLLLAGDTDDKRTRGQILPEEERTVEAMNIVLGFGDTVRQCGYYTSSDEGKKEIEEKAEVFRALSPRETEDALLEYVATSRFPL